jgi:hypothetical protein
MTNTASIKKRILKRRGVVLAPQTRAPLQYHESVTNFVKSDMMKFLELKFNCPILDLVDTPDTIYQCAKKLNVDPTTISKWRKRIREANSKSLSVDKTIEKVL